MSVNENTMRIVIGNLFLAKQIIIALINQEMPVNKKSLWKGSAMWLYVNKTSRRMEEDL